MALFGFGKKKKQDPVSNFPEQNNTVAPPDIPKTQQFYQLNGMWLVNPNYESEKTASSSSTSTVYTEDVDKFLARNDDAKLVRLTGKPEELACYEVGNRCHVEYDYDIEKYGVTVDGDVIGYLPSSAISYAEKHETDPEGLDVIISEVEYDLDIDHDVISVYIA